MIRTGRLTTPLEVQALTETGTGIDAKLEWVSLPGIAWAEMWAVKGDERTASASTMASVSHRARMWAYPGLTTAHRFKLGSRTFNITFINDVEQGGVEFVVDCLEITGREAQ